MWWISSGAMTTADKLQASNFSCSQKRRYEKRRRRKRGGRQRGGECEANVKQFR